MGLVPTYARWGVAASALMVTLRLVQGFCLGGELPGALTYVVETAPRIAPFVCGVVFACVTMGVAAATGVSLSVRTLLPPAIVPAFGWRIAFILGGLGGSLSFVLRRSLEESPEFARMQQPGVAPAVSRGAADARRPVAASAARCWPARPASTACSSRTCRRISSSVLHYDPRQAVLLADRRRRSRSALGILATGWLGDRVPPRYLLRAGVDAARCCWRIRSTRRSPTRTRQSDAAADAGGRRAPA